MKTKIIPFNLEMAKKIQAGEIEGHIITRDGRFARIICFNRYDQYLNIISLIDEGSYESIHCYYNNGLISLNNQSDNDLFIEIPELKPQFKPFDKVLVKQLDDCEWRCGFFSHLVNSSEYPYVTISGAWKYCIPYEGNQELVGTTNKPNEE